MPPPNDIAEPEDSKSHSLEGRVNSLMAAAEESQVRFAEMARELAEMSSKLTGHDAKAAQQGARIEQLEHETAEQRCVIDQLSRDIVEQDEIIKELSTEQGMIFTSVSRIADGAAELMYAVGRHEAAGTRHTATITEHGDMIERLDEAAEDLHDRLLQSAEQHQSHFDVINQICDLLRSVEHRIANIHAHIGIDPATLGDNNDDDDQGPLIDEDRIIDAVLAKLVRSSGMPKNDHRTARAAATAAAASAATRQQD